ncbi:MAG: hypothetical protein N2C14_13670, partial [Planctomycetales bacterium]
PKDKLLNLVREDMQRQHWKLRKQPKVTAEVGPVDGFRINYQLSRRTALSGGALGAIVEVTRWSLIPDDDRSGDTLEGVLAPNSRFREFMRTRDPKKTTITLWVYSESFRACMGLQQELRRMGFAAAVRPLPQGMPISGSPHGARSAAQ